MADGWKGQVQKAKAQERLNYCAMKLHPCSTKGGFETQRNSLARTG